MRIPRPLTCISTWKTIRRMRRTPGHAHWGPCPSDSSAQCWTGDKNGAMDKNNGTIWNGKSQQWEQPQPPPQSTWQQFLSWRHNFINDWKMLRKPGERRDVHRFFGDHAQTVRLACREALTVFFGRPPFCGSSERKVRFSRSAMNSGVPSGRPVG
jgi:hypothetical protein